MQSSIVGTRIRQQRRKMGVTQADLARKSGISPSYLNLIEWNKRRIGGTLLRKIAETLNLSLENLDGAAERRLREALIEIAHLPTLAALGIEIDSTSEFIGRYPGWARGMAALARAESEMSAHVQSLSDRLSNDPFLGEAIHRMLTRIAAVRSAVDILVEYPDLGSSRRDRFTGIIHEESQALSKAGEALAAYLDKTEEAHRVLTPLDEVEALFEAHEHHFPEIENAAQQIAGEILDHGPVSPQTNANQLQSNKLGEIIAEIIDRQSQFGTTAAKARAKRALSHYATSAILMPQPFFAEQAREHGYDIETLAEAYSVEIEQVCHRLTALPRSDETPHFGYFQANAAGTIIEMLGLEGLAAPRYGAACPLWVLYRAQQSPETVMRQRAIFPSGHRYIFVARARHQGKTGFGRPRHYITDMIAMTENAARSTIYAPDPSAPLEEIGPSCRMCPRRTCKHRVEDPLAD